MYPQYASATTGSSLERLFQELERRRVVPSVRVVPPYFADPGYIGALAAVARETVAASGEPPDQLCSASTGCPSATRRKAIRTPITAARQPPLLEPALAWPEVACTLAFQSRFGREEWLQPYTDKTLEALGSTGARVAVMCPGFTADCLETLEEIGLRGAEQFQSTGGRSFRLIPCLNTHPAWIDAMTTIAQREMGGWL